VSTFISLAELEHSSKPTQYGPGASSAVTVPKRAAMGAQPPLPTIYRELSAAELDRRIEHGRRTLGPELTILGHHYQRDEVVKHADFLGDSYKLSIQAAGRRDAKYIVFCGVYFMAESADVLSGPDQTVILPNLAAGCSMADMAGLADVLVAWDRLRTQDDSVVPVTYMNSSAALKAFCGEHGGIVCTSSNAPAVLQWGFSHGRRVLFFPDEHLGRNTADIIGLSQDHVAVWNPRDTVVSMAASAAARLIVWKGFCSVHERFAVDQITKARTEHPGCQVVVHPECHRDVVIAADSAGSTEFIVSEIEKGAKGMTFAIGTEVNLVKRLAEQHPDKTIFCLDPVVCPCSTMYRIHPAYLAWTLDNLLEGTVVNQIKVEASIAENARTALRRMISVTAAHQSPRRFGPSAEPIQAAAGAFAAS